MSGKIKVGVATVPFIECFRYYYDDVEVVKNVSDYDLIIFTGGADISPEIYGQKNRYSSYSEKRDKIELKVLEESIKLNKKILGVCRGHQLINAYLGGMLVQDIYRVLNKSHKGFHELIFTEEKSLVKDSYKGGVNSMHHQGVIKPGKNLIVTSVYEDVIESTESENIISVQFHPEFMSNNNFFYKINEWILG